MKIGLIDVDGHHFPNLALMKLSAWHKAKGDIVEWVNYFERYDIVYKSKVFTFTPDDQTAVRAERIITGGTGYRDYTISLPEAVEHICPDYGLYPKLSAAYGFLTRGCQNHCPWCVVPKKEGAIRPHAELSEFIAGRKEAVLLDNNVLASDWGLAQIEEIVRQRIRVDFNQGLDVRMIGDNPDVAKLLGQVRWVRFIRMAYDHIANEDAVMKAIKRLQHAGISPGRMFFYVLVKDVADAERRVEQLRTAGAQPFAQPFRDFTTNAEPTREQKRFARWCNHKAIYNSVEFSKYKG